MGQLGMLRRRRVLGGFRGFGDVVLDIGYFEDVAEGYYEIVECTVCWGFGLRMMSLRGIK